MIGGIPALKIKVEKVRVNGSAEKIYFSTEYGNAVANWDGDLPEEGMEYFVEIEISESLILGSNLKICEEEKFTIGMEQNSVFLIGCLESIEDDGYAVFRFGESIISLEIEGTHPLESYFVKVVPDKITLYDVKY
ncbi:hypothetical protein [Brevibacillus choshinensis]|uniref:hypothetical protein n=1 Tax=Brevibacillus choshinensis TaxID=54911 RepID=UPI002E23F9C9|nr:hypothetical protein [Brevibacillus choshinensis]